MREVLRAASLAIDEGERIGLVGRNGAGKTTLARILAGLEEPDAGEVTRRAGLRIGLLLQEPRFAPGLTAVQAVLAGLDRWQTAIHEHERTTRLLAEARDDLDALLHAQARAASDVEAAGGWDMRHAAEAMLGHVGITEPDAELDRLSGGEQRRVALAQVLLTRPDLAILDEPTNHLDLAAVEWLEQFLGEEFKGALVLVTHDRQLLDAVVDRTLEIEAGEVHSYDGGWLRYLEAKAERAAIAERTEANRRNFLRRELEWLRRSPPARTTKQKARIDRAQAVIERPVARADRAVQIAVESGRTGNIVLETQDLDVAVPGRLLVEGLTLHLVAGDRVGVFGPSGCGKSSLLRCLLGQLAPARGTVRLGKNVRVAWVDQRRSVLREDATVFEMVGQGRTRVELGGETLDMRSYLERFLFCPADQRQQISTLSGGERARVALAHQLRDGAELVVLDEPTNDLDATTLGALEQALLDYGGSLLVVTHDRWFLDRVATSLLVFEGARVVRHAGGYGDWVARRPTRAPAIPPALAPKPVPAAPRPAGPRKLTYAERLELEGLLDRVDAAERRVADLQAERLAPAFFTRPIAEQRAHGERLAEAEAEAARLADRWTDLEQRRDA